MPFRALALDYDGTIARNGVLDDEVRHAIAEVRAAGIPVLIVTGRIVSDLRGVAGDLDFIDAVVGENGAVLSLPGNGRSEMLTAAASPALVGDLRAARVPVSVGQCVIESDAVLAPRLQESIQRVKAPYALTFNGTRVMALPSGVTKASGLIVALRALRLSPNSCRVRSRPSLSRMFGNYRCTSDRSVRKCRNSGQRGCSMRILCAARRM